MKSLFSRSLLPLLLLTLGAAPLAASPEHWADEINKLTAADAATPPPAHAVVFVGSSSIRLWQSLAQDFPGIATINRGFGGSELADSVFYEDRLVLAYRPRLVVLFAGTNDLWAGKTPETVFADFQAFRAKLQAALPDTRLLYIAITLAPSRARIHDAMRTTNRLIAAECAKDPRCTFVDFNPLLAGSESAPRVEFFRDDHLHLNPAGYAVWAKALAPYLQP